MDFELRWTERASSDIEAIVRYIARRDPKAAAKIGIGIFERAQQLIDHPNLGSLEISLPRGEWHKLVYRKWKIVYSIRGTTIIVGRVWPCAMDEIDFERPLED